MRWVPIGAILQSNDMGQLPEDGYSWISNELEKPLALVIRGNYQSAGLEFLTTDDSPFQVGIMTRPTGEYIEAHVHEKLQRTVIGTSEFLLVQSGQIRVDIFTEERVYVKSALLNGGDCVLLISGGHGIEIISEARILEVKQGPYTSGLDKTKFKHVLPGNLEN